MVDFEPFDEGTGVAEQHDAVDLQIAALDQLHPGRQIGQHRTDCILVMVWLNSPEFTDRVR